MSSKIMIQFCVERTKILLAIKNIRSGDIHKNNFTGIKLIGSQSPIRSCKDL